MLGGTACLASLGMLAAGVAQLASGRISGLLPALLSWIPATAMAALNVFGMRSLDQDIPQLLEEVNRVLDPTAAFPGSPAVPAGRSNRG